MAYDFSGFKKKVEGVTEHLTKELSGIHTGRASVSLLDGVTIESYGARLAIPHVATVATEDARTLRIVPWDKMNGKEIEKAINNADLGVSVSIDDMGLRVFFPPLTTERRISFTKMVRDRVEDARVALKGEREKVKNEITAKGRDGELNEDDTKRALDDMQKIVDDAHHAFEIIGEKKEKDILSE